MSIEAPVKQKKSSKSSSSSKKRKLEQDVATAETVAEESSPLQVEDAEPSTAAAAEGRRRAGVNDELEPEPDAVSHAEQRKRRKLEKKQKVAKVVEGDDDDGEHLGEPAAAASTSTPSSATAATSKDSNTEKRSGHGVWVGNLSFKTDSERLRKFFAPCGAITRLYMPKGGQKFAQNKGFAYIDFEDPVGVTTAISMSEQNLDGRRLLIKDSKSYEGRPKSAATEAVTAAVAGPAGASTGDKSMSKTARKILDRQKNPPAPTLFAGNLGFETTVDMIKEAVEAHFQATLAWEKKTKRDRKRAAKGKEKATEDDAEDSSASDSGSEGEDDEGMKAKDSAKEKNAGIRKVRLGTFEDSGKCKGWAFIDFLTSQQATAALVNGKNHYLNGRALTLEFASADAVRRGGGRMDGAASISAPAKDGKRSFDKRRQRSDAAENEVEQAVEGEEEEHQPIEQAFYRPPLQTNPYAASEASRVAAAIIQAGGKLHKPNKAERKALRDQKAKDDRSSSKRRVKPGAALADAKRENMAILPAAGKKVVFDD